MRAFAALLLILVLAIGGGVIATTAYQAGLDTAVTAAVADGATVAPVVVPAYGFGWHGAGFGFGLFGLFATVFFVFIVFALIRALFFRGTGRRGGWGGGPGSWSGSHGPWERHAQETFDTWHQLAHKDSPDAPPDRT